MFASVIRLQKEPAGPGVMRVPGGKPVAIFLATLGIFTTAVSSILACIPPADEPNKFIAVTKIIGSTALMITLGVLIYVGKRKTGV